MFQGGLENTSGITAETFFPELLAFFSRLSAREWLEWLLGLGVFVFLFFIVPGLLRRYGGRNWN